MVLHKILDKLKVEYRPERVDRNRKELGEGLANNGKKVSSNGRNPQCIPKATLHWPSVSLRFIHKQQPMEPVRTTYLPTFSTDTVAPYPLFLLVSPSSISLLPNIFNNVGYTQCYWTRNSSGPEVELMMPNVGHWVYIEWIGGRGEGGWRRE